MQFSENWLRQYVATTLTTDELSHALTMSGLEVEGLQPVGAVFSKVVIAQILSAEKHPDADRLQVCKVDVGAAEPLQIVCGASNARAGLKAPCALVGAALPGFAIKEAKVRGVASFGMMCSEKELGLAAESTGLLELPDDAVVGQDIREYFDLNDQLFTLKLTPNRSDCLSIVGVAREVAALTGAALHLPQITAASVASAATKNVQVQARQACPRYTGRLIQGVNAQAKSPDWLVRHIERGGVRSISAIVDITNYVLLELGQPLHAFDANTLQGDIQVRMAQVDETLTLLNQQEVKLHADMLVIADNSGAIALAGVMGGASTAVSDVTTDIFLESAFFTPDAIAGKARRLGLSTDSSFRFERGVDYGNTLLALERATALIVEICGGQVGAITEILAELPVRKPVLLRLAKLSSVLGIHFDATTVAALLQQLGFAFSTTSDSYWVTPPSYRFDIEIEEDLIEEIARLHGYDHIPALAPQAELSMLPNSERSINRAVFSDILVASGYQEIVSYSFVDLSWERDLLGNSQPIALKNPIASNMSVMRSGLWGGLLDALVYNLNRKQERVRLFEIGASYAKVEAGYSETTRISGLAYGDATPEQWADAARAIDFYDIKADVDTLTHGRAQYVAAQHPALHPGQTAQIYLDGKAIGWLGKLHPKWQQHYQLPKTTILFELDLQALQASSVTHYIEVAKFPPVRRDMAILVDDKIAVKEILNAMEQAQLNYVHDIALFDVYRGKGIAENKKSLAFLVLMQDTQKTLTDAEIDQVMADLLALVKLKFGAELR
jgi:phenylalanyl-tRNA synthetase beta chain